MLQRGNLNLLLYRCLLYTSRTTTTIAAIARINDTQQPPHNSNSTTPMLGIASISSSLRRLAFTDSITPLVLRQDVSEPKTEIT
jgi:hypothetical protein